MIAGSRVPLSPNEALGAVTVVTFLPSVLLVQCFAPTGQFEREDAMAAEPLHDIEVQDVEIREFGEYIMADPRICHGK
jgi:hypothetical protein